MKSEKVVRFLRSEITERWPVDPANVVAIDTSREGVIEFLQTTFQFSRNRAAAEADELLSSFQAKLERATDHHAPLVKHVSAA
jgi:hypothetical protein